MKNKKTKVLKMGFGTIESNIPGFILYKGKELRELIMSLPDDDPLKIEATAAWDKAKTKENPFDGAPPRGQSDT